MKRQPKLTLIVAEFDTPNFAFRGVGRTKAEALDAIVRGWKVHCRQYDADPNYLTDSVDPLEDQCIIHTFTPGECWRYGDEHPLVTAKGGKR
jgi:hypothetical protein